MIFGVKYKNNNIYNNNNENKYSYFQDTIKIQLYSLNLQAKSCVMVTS